MEYVQYLSITTKSTVNNVSTTFTGFMCLTIMALVRLPSSPELTGSPEYLLCAYMSLIMRKPAFCICENNNADQLRGNREADQRLCFATQLVQFLFFLNTKFQASSHLPCLYSPVCARPGQKPRRPVFAQRGSYVCDLVSSESYQCS